MSLPIVPKKPRDSLRSSQPLPSHSLQDTLEGLEEQMGNKVAGAGGIGRMKDESHYCPNVPNFREALKSVKLSARGVETWRFTVDVKNT